MFTGRHLWQTCAGVGLALLAFSAQAGWKDRMEALDQRYVSGVFRIYYTANGLDAFNAEPAVIDTLARQLQRADQFYAQQLGLMPPLRSPKYQEVRAIDVHLRRMEGQSGSAGDAAVTYRYRRFGDNVPALTISLSTRWQPNHVTPEHEVFHAYQYGYTFFKNPWFLEGLARSMEAVFRGKPESDEPLPQTPMALNELLTRSYSAAPVWTRLMRLCEPSCKVDKNSASFRPDATLCGGALVKPLLESLQKIDPDAAQARGLNPKDWPEHEQSSNQNNPWILKGLRQALEKQCPISSQAELATFHQLLK